MTPQPQSVWKTAYNVFTWLTIVGLVWTLILVLHKSPAPSIPTDPTAVARVEQKFAAAEQQKSAGGTAQVALDSTELNSYLSQNLQLEGSPQAGAPSPAGTSSATGAVAAAPPGNSGGLPDANGATIEEVQSSVKDVKVDMDGDLVKAYVTFDFHGKDLSLELDGHLGTENGYVKFEPVAGKLGSLPLPQSALQSAVDKMMLSPENREKLKLPNDISNVQIQNGQAVVSYKDQQ
jgi:hypothetical protein